MGNDYSTQTLKVKSKMASQRMQAHVSKRENQLVKSRRAIAQLLVDGKEQSARIKVEGVLREEDLCRVMEWLMMMCDLIHQRVKQIEVAKTCPEDLLESIATLLYCAKRVDVPELSEVGGQFRAKWGQKWFDQNIENRSGRVSKQIVEKLSPQPPAREKVLKKLKEIADQHDIDYEPGDMHDDDMPEIVSHANEYTVEFDAKPFGMEWTATEDACNLWVSNVTPVKPAARMGVVPGSMLIALNGIDVQNLGASSIHEKAASIGLPLRITFRKPAALNAPTNKKDFAVNPDTVNKCVAILKDPSKWEYSDLQKQETCKQMGANAAEAASAIFLSQHMIEMANKQQMQPQQPMQPPQTTYMGMNDMNMGMNDMNMGAQQPQQPYYPPGPDSGTGGGYPGPSSNDFPPQSSYPPMQPQQPMQPMQPQQPMQPMQPMHPQQPMQPMQPQQPMQPMQPQQPMQPPSGGTNEAPPTEPAGNDLDELEARFAALRKGL